MTRHAVLTGTDLSRHRLSIHTARSHKITRFVIIIIIIIIIIIYRNRGLSNSNTGPSHTNKNYKKYILKQPHIDKLSRRCGKESQTIQHITETCEQLTPTECVKRHDGLAKVIHQKLAEAAELTEDKSPYYEYTSANVLENDHFKLYWNRNILTGQNNTF
jgi:hypothetical protein